MQLCRKMPLRRRVSVCARPIRAGGVRGTERPRRLQFRATETAGAARSSQDFHLQVLVSVLPWQCLALAMSLNITFAVAGIGSRDAAPTPLNDAPLPTARPMPYRRQFPCLPSSCLTHNLRKNSGRHHLSDARGLARIGESFSRVVAHSSQFWMLFQAFAHRARHSHGRTASKVQFSLPS